VLLGLLSRKRLTHVYVERINALRTQRETSRDQDFR
jgi:hypothetical protein